MSWFTKVRDTVENVVAAPVIAAGGGNTVKGLQAKSAQDSGLQNLLNKPEQIGSDISRGAAVIGGAILAAPLVASGASAVGITGAGSAAAGGKLIADEIKGASTPQANPQATPGDLPTANSPAKSDLTVPVVIATAGLLAIKLLA